jgi:hypothetical protein
MKKELESQLVNKYPKILKDYEGDPMQTCMAWGLATGDGWYDILDEAMAKIQYFCDMCSKDGREVQLIASQIKTKFGSLRFYVDIIGANEIENKILNDFVDKAERKSYSSCEVCGNYAKPSREGSWVQTICDEHKKDKKFLDF